MDEVETSGGCGARTGEEKTGKEGVELRGPPFKRAGAGRNRPEREVGVGYGRSKVPERRARGGPRTSDRDDGRAGCPLLTCS